jgi:diguanylate cyclase (GGDEF)-like protein
VPHQKPELTLTSRLLIKAAGATEFWRPITQWSVAILSLATVLAVDFLTGTQATLIFLYLLIAGFAAWSLGERKGLVFAILIALAATTLRHFQYLDHPERALKGATEAWNGLARLLSFSLVVVLVSGMRTALQLERWRASTDGLTGVLNKASFHQQMTAAVAAGRNGDLAFILCYMDLDGFKQVNDRYGHSAGDDILRLFANAAVDAIRDKDLFARIGGDEFVALLTIPTKHDGDHVAALVHHRISTILAKTGLPVSCSMGALVATATQLEPLEAAVQLADSLMYEVKRSGKNALRVGRIDPTKALIAPDCLEIKSDLAPSATIAPRSGVIVADRRAA